MKTLWWSQCRCGKTFELEAESVLTREQINDIFMEKHGMSLFPSRCKDCRNAIQISSNGDSAKQ